MMTVCMAMEPAPDLVDGHFTGHGMARQPTRLHSIMARTETVTHRRVHSDRGSSSVNCDRPISFSRSRSKLM